MAAVKAVAAKVAAATVVVKAVDLAAKVAAMTAASKVVAAMAVVKVAVKALLPAIWMTKSRSKPTFWPETKKPRACGAFL